jgi:hypothetical protein
VISYREDIICVRCGHAVLLDEIVKVWTAHRYAIDLVQRLETLIEKAKQLGFGEVKS